MREVLGRPKAIVPAAKTIGGPGTRLMVPLGHIHAAYVRSHFGTAEMTMWTRHAATKSCSASSWQPAAGHTPALADCRPMRFQCTTGNDSL